MGCSGYFRFIGEKRPRLPYSNFFAETDQRVSQHAQSQRDVYQAPDIYAADADQYLGVLGFGQGKIEGAVVDGLDKLRHAGLNYQADDAAHQQVHAHESKDFRLPPPSQGIGKRKNDTQAGDSQSQADQRLEQLEEKVDTVGHFTGDTDPEKGHHQAQVIHAPTAE